MALKDQIPEADLVRQITEGIHSRHPRADFHVPHFFCTDRGNASVINAFPWIVRDLLESDTVRRVTAPWHFEGMIGRPPVAVMPHDGLCPVQRVQALCLSKADVFHTLIFAQPGVLQDWNMFVEDFFLAHKNRLQPIRLTDPSKAHRHKIITVSI